MLNRKTRSNKDKELVNLTNQELAHLERTNRKARTPVAMNRPLILHEDADGNLVDREGNRRNEEGQKLDDAGNVIEEAPAALPAAAQAQPVVNNVAAPAAPQAQLVPNRTLGDHNRPDLFYANRSAIRPPSFQRNDFELKPAYYTLVGQHLFHGLPHEHPMDHIERFEDLANSIKAHGVSSDYLFCKLFPYSLGGDAAYWLKQLQPGSLTNWEDTKKAFLNNFYDDARSEELRNNISQFSQGPTEAFKASWVRFRSYQRDCPHHGFTEVQLLGIFFRGIDWRYQMALDAASNGNFNTRYPAEAYKLIENLASSNSTKNADLERKRLGGNLDGSQIAAVTAKLDSMHSLLVGKKSVKFAAEVESFEPAEESQEEDVNYINGAGFQGQRWGNQQGSGSSYQKPFTSSNFTRTYGSSSYHKPPDQNNEIKAMLEQIIEGQQRITVEFNGKMDAMYLDLNGKFESLSTHVKKLDIQVAQTADAVKRQEGFLPGRTDVNPKRSCQAIMVENGVDLEIIQETAAVFRTTEAVSIDTTAGCRSTPEEEKTYDGRLSSELLDTSKIVSTPEPSVDRHHLGVGRHQSQTTAGREKAAENGEERVYKPKIPFPRPPRKSKKELEDAKIKAIMDKLMVAIPLIDAVSLSPALRRYVKRMMMNGVSPEEGALLTRDITEVILSTMPKQKKKVTVSEEVSAVIQNKIPEKLQDPGNFVLESSISTRKFPHSLCDLGSSVNLMPLSVAASLGMTDFKPTRISLILADRSKRIPLGILEDVPLKIEGHLVPTDFVVLEYDAEPIDPLILGRSFLATAGAIIDVKQGKIELSLGAVVLNFDMDKLRRKPTIDGQSFSVEISKDEDPIREPLDDIAVGYDKEPATSEQVNKLEVKSEDIIAHHIIAPKPPIEQRYVLPALNSKPPDIINKNFNGPQAVSHLRKQRDSRKLGVSSDDFAGKRSVPPRLKHHPASVPHFLGRSHAPNAYTPPWMRRHFSQKHVLPLSDPPDA